MRPLNEALLDPLQSREHKLAETRSTLAEYLGITVELGQSKMAIKTIQNPPAEGYAHSHFSTLLLRNFSSIQFGKTYSISGPRPNSKANCSDEKHMCGQQHVD